MDGIAVDTFVARQPIFDLQRAVHGYELLFRSGPENVFHFTDPDVASSRVVDDGLHVFGLNRLAGKKAVFVNLTHRLLEEDLAFVLPPKSTVVEILETVEPDDAVVEACRRLRHAGYRIALDDFTFRPEMEPLLELANVVKVDFRATDAGTRRDLVALLLPRKIRLLAEKVETAEEFREAVEMGYSYFQGYFFARPEMVARRDIPAFKLNYIRFLHELSQVELDFGRLEKIIKSEVSLSVRLLRYLNSAALGLRCRVSSIRHALALLGEGPMRRWAYLVAMAGIGRDKPAELVVTSLIRARFCELIGASCGRSSKAPDLFLVGTLSMVDALMGRPIEEVMKELLVSDEIKETILHRATSLSAVFELVLAYERGNWDDVAGLAQQLHLPEEALPTHYFQAMDWAQQIFAL